MSDPGTEYPTSLAGYTSQPVSAPPSFAPTPPAPPRPPRRVGTVILAALSSLLLVATGVMSVLFLGKKDDATKLNSQVASLTAEAASNQTKLTSLQRELDNTKRDLTDAKAEGDELADHKQILTECIFGIYDFFEALDKANGAQTADVKAKQAAANKECNEADKVLPAR